MILDEDLNKAIQNVIEKLEGVSQLYAVQIQLLTALVKQENVFFTSATNSGKTLPAVIFPEIVDELNKLGYELSPGRVLFITALNSIQMSMLSSLKDFGIECSALTSDNFEEVLASEVKVIFVSPECMKQPRITRCLLSHRKEFLLKVIDEAHLGWFNINT